MIVRVLFTLASYSYVACALVSETTMNYPCQEGSQVLKLENANRAINCEQSWTADSIPIGSFMSGSVECHSPCITVTDGEIVISGCVNATLTVICNQVHVTEFRTHYLGIQSNPLPLQDYKKTDRHHYGTCACVMLLLLIFVGFSIQHCISHQCTVRNTGPNQI
ncbi:hypothetical protein KOW79_000952 [Hemibagrus wyckioides]|uniref:Uncharacterized protein n=1 Tax=Hemibagrus wyckioides TaxID=337641 RepID=A0A9D3SYN7_9TELE|nr:hypothetical protein KOW79_000952 [Hemibagrus wyckioides]